jgi:hypothetical protein
MRISTNITDQEREAVKEYAVNHGYTMKRAYTQLIRDALYDRFLMRDNPGKDTVGVKFEGFENSVMTNIKTNKLLGNLEYFDGEWATVYAPRAYALSDVGIETELPPYIWFDGEDDAPIDINAVAEE